MQDGSPEPAGPAPAPGSPRDSDGISFHDAFAELADLGSAIDLAALNEGAGDAQQQPEHSDELDWDQLHFDLGSPLAGRRSGSAARARLDALEARLRAAIKAQAAGFYDPRRILLRDKLSFLLGCCQLWVTAYWLGWDPTGFYWLYTCQGGDRLSGCAPTLLAPQIVALMLVRYVSYRSKAWHYYMLDFCYMANVLLLAHLWIWPGSELLSKVTFAYSTGPLAWSTLAFRNSLVFHDLDKVTSVLMHLAPACVSWSLRWHTDTRRFGPWPRSGSSEAVEAWQRASLAQLAALPVLPYVVWASAYYATIFHWANERIRRRGYATLFQYVTTTKSGVYAAIARRVPVNLRPQVYLALHLLYCICTFCVAWLAWHSFALHTLLLGAMGLLSVWHGASYYFQVFAKRYAADLERRAAAASADGMPSGAAAPAAAQQQPPQQQQQQQQRAKAA